MYAFAAELEACLHELRAGDNDSTATVITPPAARGRPQTPRRRISPTPLIVALLALAALAVIAVAAIAVNRDRSTETTTATNTTTGSGSGGAVSLAGAAGYDPQGDDTEHDSDAPKATDGDPATYWTTEHYGDPDFGGIPKDGVGLVLDAPRQVALKKLTVTTDTPGFSAVVKAGESAGSAQTDSSTQTVNGTTTFELNGRTGSVYVLWITRLASDGAAHVNGVTATS
jgi:hypothetical protein